MTNRAAPHAGAYTADDMTNEAAAMSAEAAASRPGVVILDRAKRILAVTPFAEDLLGWRASEVVGAHCQSVFDCRDDQGASLCERCGQLEVFARREIIPPVVVRMADASRGRSRVSTTFWYLPPTGRIEEPRAMAVLRRADEVG